jgi:hypothetical protein
MKMILIYLFLAGGTLLGCASAAEKRVDQEVAQQSYVESTQQAASGGRFAIRFSDKLTEPQKIKFLDVMNKTEMQVESIKSQEGKLKSALFQSLAEGRYDRNEMAVYKKRLRKLENQKFDLMLDSLDQVQGILGKDRDANLNMELMDMFRTEMR